MFPTYWAYRDTFFNRIDKDRYQSKIVLDLNYAVFWEVHGGWWLRKDGSVCFPAKLDMKNYVNALP